jgi:quercetin dioxygenase-like cupin family protein
MGRTQKESGNIGPHHVGSTYMTRPHIEFIQSQVLPWKRLSDGSSRPGADAKALSYDPDTKAVTVIMRYPAGWSFPEAHYLDSDEEFFVLAGELWVGSVVYRRGDYAYLPAGMPRPGMNSPYGADVLTYHEGTHRTIFADAPVGLYDPARLIAKIETEAMPWGSLSDPVVAATANAAGRKLLRLDSITGERTWLLQFGADDPAKLTHGRIETHPVVEEVFVLDGEITMPMGTLQPGAYFWRPPHIEHGPVGTKKGLFGIFRCKGGPLVTHWSEHESPLNWTPPYAPILPPDMAANVTRPYDPALRY